ncbi:MAG: hypothetical protein PHY57_04080 [Ignavibacterium sp.]|nr:hypothetical protein [Ignavibacterium sp.]
MFIHKFIFCSSFLLVSLLLIRCASSYAPENYLPQTEDIPQTIYGGWITIITSPDSSIADDNWLIYGGEFIAVDDSKVYVMYDSLYQIPKYKITESILELDQKYTTTYALWVLGGSILTISNGYYGVYTLPLWLLAGIPTATGESVRDRFEMEYPNDEFWDSVKVFSRFPQGVDGIDLSQINPYLILEE